MNQIFKELGILTAMLLAFLSASAYDFEVDGIYYNISDEPSKEVSVTYKDESYNSYEIAVTLPESVNYNGVTYSVTSIGPRAFQNCDLGAVTISNSVKTIEDSAFDNCILRALVVGSSVISLGKSNIYNLEKIIWLCSNPPSGFNNIWAGQCFVPNENYSFTNQKIYPLLNSMFEIDDVVYVPVSPSEGTCDVVHSNYNTKSGNIVIDSVVTYNGAEMKVIDIAPCSFIKNHSIKTVKINNRGDVGNLAFYNCDALESVSLTNNGNIGENAFTFCWYITSVYAGNRGSIGQGAFRGSVTLNQLTITDDVTVLNKECFTDHPSLSYVTIEKSEKKNMSFQSRSGDSGMIIKTDAFSHLDKVFIDIAIPPTVEPGAFGESNPVIYVPEAYLDTYKSEPSLSDFDIVEMETTNIPEVGIGSKMLPTEIYGLNGVKVANDTKNLTPGIYLMRTGDTIRKIIIH